MALEMEKADRMLKASQSFEDKALQKAVENHVLLLDEQLAKSYDMSDLNNLAKGKFRTPYLLLRKKLQQRYQELKEPWLIYTAIYSIRLMKMEKQFRSNTQFNKRYNSARYKNRALFFLSY